MARRRKPTVFTAAELKATAARLRQRFAYCPHCGGAFLPLGLASHRAACQRRARGG